MKNEKKELFVTEISLEDFLRLDLIGYEHRKHHYRKETEKETEIEYQDTGEWIEDSKGGKHWVAFDDCFSRLQWDKVRLNDIVLENIEFSKEQGWTGAICVAIHEEIELNENDFRMINSDKIDLELKKEKELFESSYLDKWLTREGYQTYLIRCDVKHLYSRRNYFYTTDDYFDIDKRETKAVYLIHWN